MGGPFVYRLGRKIFILERGVRFPQGLPIRRTDIPHREDVGALFFYVLSEWAQVACSSTTGLLPQRYTLLPLDNRLLCRR